MGEYKYKKTDEAERLKKHRKITRNEFENAPQDEKYEKLQKYIEAERDLRRELEIYERNRVEQRINLIIKQG